SRALGRVALGLHLSGTLRHATRNAPRLSDAQAVDTQAEQRTLPQRGARLEGTQAPNECEWLQTGAQRLSCGQMVCGLASSRTSISCNKGSTVTHELYVWNLHNHALTTTSVGGG